MFLAVYGRPVVDMFLPITIAIPLFVTMAGLGFRESLGGAGHRLHRAYIA